MFRIRTLGLPTQAEPSSTSGSTLRVARLAFTLLGLLLFAISGETARAQSKPSPWRSATDAELKALLPARAPVEREHIETELRAASGITNGRGKYFAGVVLITAGYSADGKYSHFLILQVPVRIGDMLLPAGEYVLGWKRGEELLDVHLYDAATGTPRGSVEARRIASSTRVEAFKVWTPQTRSILQIGRFGIPYRLEEQPPAKSATAP